MDGGSAAMDRKRRNTDKLFFGKPTCLKYPLILLQHVPGVS